MIKHITAAFVAAFVLLANPVSSQAHGIADVAFTYNNAPTSIKKQRRYQARIKARYVPSGSLRASNNRPAKWCGWYM